MIRKQRGTSWGKRENQLGKGEKIPGKGNDGEHCSEVLVLSPQFSLESPGKFFLNSLSRFFPRPTKSGTVNMEPQTYIMCSPNIPQKILLCSKS